MRRPTLLLSLIPVVSLIGMLFVSIALLGGSGHIPLIMATAVAGLVAALGLGMKWDQIEKGMAEGIGIALPAILILLIVGLLIGIWIAGGIVPLMIFYGLKILAPSYFLVATCIICALVSLATGSSWSTAASVGLALVGVGHALGVSPQMTAGAIISGAYFGDKMSPLSDTTNLAPAMAGTRLFTHIRHMVYTTTPSLLITLVIFAVIGLSIHAGGSVQTPEYTQLVTTLQADFNLSPWLLLAPGLVLFLVIRKTPALPALLGGVVAGMILFLLFQRNTPGMAGSGVLSSMLDALYSGYVSNTGVPMVDELLTRGGLTSMLNTIGLILAALAFGGVMEASGMLGCIAESILKLARTTGTLVAATIGSCVAMNILAPDQYLSIVVPGRMYQDAYLRRGLHPKNLSRALEDAGTLTSPLVPWNTCGAYMSSVLGVATFAYLPFAFFNLINPLVSIIYGFTGFTIQRIEDDPESVTVAIPAPAPVDMGGEGVS